MDAHQLEQLADELVAAYDNLAPPVRIESMLQQPLPGMWEELDIARWSSSFINIADLYSPRMSLARLLARNIAASDWGRERGLDEISADEEQIRAFARMLAMPSSLMQTLSPEARNAAYVSRHYEVPVDEAALRLSELRLGK